MRRSKIFRKTLLLMFVLFGVISTLTSVLSAWTLNDHMTREYESKGKAIAQAIADSSAEVMLNRDASTIQAMIDQFLKIEGAGYVFVTDADGQIISHTFVPAVPSAVQALSQARTGLVVTRLDLPDMGEVMDISQSILAGVAGRVHVGMRMDVVRSYVVSAIVRMQIMLFFVFWGCVFVLYLVVKRFAKPIDRLAEYARSLAERDFSATVDIQSKDEVGMLARTMQSMAGELSSHFDGLERAVQKATTDLSDTLTFMRTIIDNLADGLVVVDVTGHISLYNPALAKMFDVGDEELTGKSVGEVLPATLGDLAEAIRGYHREAYRAEVSLADDRTGIALATSITKPGENAMCLGSVILIRDITREKELDHLKTDFISTISHELRTPMTSVLGFTKIIKKKLAGAVFPSLDSCEPGMRRALTQVGDNVEIIVAESERLTELVNDVLDIAKLEAGKVEWHQNEVDIGKIIEHSVATIRVLAETKGLALNVEVGNNLPAIVADRDRIIQVVVNLLSNAIKFTSQGHVLISAEQNGQMILVRVEDTGEGIEPDEQERIFEKFKQVGNTLTDKPQGTGLGLPISSQIVEHHGGSIWVESTPGKGSSFAFTLPLVPPDDLAARHEVPPEDSVLLVRPLPDRGSWARPSVLVVEDDKNVNAYLVELFTEFGLEATGALNGYEALEQARLKLPGLITMDVMMPGMDGASCIERLRADPFTRHIPIIVITAAAALGQRAGGDAALVKPVDEERLLELASAFLGQDRLSSGCLVLGRDPDDPAVSQICNICPGEIVYCPPEELWVHLDRGFTGTIFVPLSLRERVELDKLAAREGVQVVILPG